MALKIVHILGLSGYFCGIINPKHGDREYGELPPDFRGQPMQWCKKCEKKYTAEVLQLAAEAEIERAATEHAAAERVAKEATVEGFLARVKAATAAERAAKRVRKRLIREEQHNKHAAMRAQYAY